MAPWRSRAGGSVLLHGRVCVFPSTANPDGDFRPREPRDIGFPQPRQFALDLVPLGARIQLARLLTDQANEGGVGRTIRTILLSHVLCCLRGTTEIFPSFSTVAS